MVTKEDLKEIQRIYHKRYEEKHKDKVLAYRKKYYREHRDKILAYGHARYWRLKKERELQTDKEKEK